MHELLKSKGYRPRKGKVVTCPICKKDFYLSKCFWGRKYCSQKCMGIDRTKEKIILICSTCETKFKVYPSTYKWNKIREHKKDFCSIKCRAVSQVKLSDERIKNNPTSLRNVNKSIRWSKKMRDWREAVFKRDNYTCRFCGIKGGYLEADHIKPFASYPKLRFEIDNGRILCKPCHLTTDTWGNKKSHTEKTRIENRNLTKSYTVSER